MRNASTSAALKEVATLFENGPKSSTAMAGLTDGSLLDRFRRGSGDEAEAAFASLMDRHGPMVLGVCRKFLGDRGDAEDAAQAAFLVLARRARSIRRGDAVASWLYGVAGRIAARSRRESERRWAIERRGAEVAASLTGRSRVEADPDGSIELYEELGRLPDRFRLPVLLCYLEGLSHEQAAERLDCPVRTVQSRLSRARSRLRDRLSRRGLGPSSVPLLAALAREPVSVFVSSSWKQVTVRAAVRQLAGGPLAGVVSVSVATLVQGVSRTMIVHRLIQWTVSLALAGAIAAGGLGMATLARPTSVRDETPRGEAPRDERYRMAMAGGATVEVVAVSTLPTGVDTWWKPDGTRLIEAPIDAVADQIHHQEGEVSRLILVRASGLARDDLFRWVVTPTASYSGSRPQKDGKTMPGLEYYQATFPRDLAECGVEARVAAGPWKTEVSNDGGGGVGRFVNGHKFSFGKARPFAKHGRPMSVFSVAHNFFGQDRRLVAIDLEGKPHPADSYSSGSDGDRKWVIDLIDGEFDLPPERVREYQVQFRPFESREVGSIALNPRPGDRPPTNPLGPKGGTR